MKTKYHRDGSVTIWSVYEQVWRRCRSDNEIGDHEYAAMSEQERQKVSAHIHGWIQRAARGTA
jgi:hypothetical protein